MKNTALLLILLAGSSMRPGAAQPCPSPGPVGPRPWQGPKLIEAILQSDVDAAKALIAAGTGLNERDNQGNTPLVAALTPRARLEPAGILPEGRRTQEIEREFKAQSAIVPLLLAKGADPNAPGALGRTPLTQVSAWGHSPMWDRRTAEALLSHGARVDGADAFGNTALMLATERRKADLVRLLAEHGANPAEKNCHGESAISIARTKKFADVLRVLERPGKATPR